jgi:hypothetical protein
MLGYQPFILADDVEVGEGLNLCRNYEGVETPHDMNCYAPHHNVGNRKQPHDVAMFHQRNEEYRQIYGYICDQIEAHAGVEGLTFAEIGCNTGLNLFNLAKRGAKACYGYDWNNMKPVFSWLNGMLDTDVMFHMGTYSNLKHEFVGANVAEVDIMVNTVFLNHQCDPLQFLSFICDRARKGVFLWVLVEGDGQCGLFYPETPLHDILETDRPFPLFFNNGIGISESLLRISLARLGFEKFVPIQRFEPGPDWANFQRGFRMYYAARTSSLRSAYSPTLEQRIVRRFGPSLQPFLETRFWKKTLRPIKRAIFGQREP